MRPLPRIFGGARMANYSQLTTAQQSDITILMQMLSPLMGEFARFLNRCTAVDAHYISRASTALSAMTVSQFSGTNLTATGGNTAAPVVSSATHVFTTDEIDNLLNLPLARTGRRVSTKSRVFLVMLRSWTGLAPQSPRLRTARGRSALWSTIR